MLSEDIEKRVSELEDMAGKLTSYQMFTQMRTAYMPALAEIKANEWVSVEDRLPEADTLVMYYFDVVGVHLGYCDPSLGNHFYNRYGFLNDDVTHWKPITKPEAGE